MAQEPIYLSAAAAALNREERRYFYSVFNKYPLADWISIPAEVQDEVIEHYYLLRVEGVNHGALNLKMIHSLGCIAMTLNTHEDIAVDQLVLFREDAKEEHLVDNLYGDTSNTARLATVIGAAIAEALPIYDRLLYEFGDCICDERFRKQFLGFPLAIQRIIIDEVMKAKDRGLQTPFAVDNDLIKRCRLSKVYSFKLCELRIHEPVGVRLYFAEIEGKMYLASVLPKPASKVQTNDINNAAASVNRMLVQEI